MKSFKFTPYMIITLSFFSVIIIGMFLLKLPMAYNGVGTLPWIDAFFTSTSLVTVTGLTTVSNLGNSFTTFGKIILACLIQVGGLSVLTLTVYIMTLLGSKIGFNNRAVLKESLNQNSLQGLVKLVKRIIVITFTIEFIGFIINLIVFIPVVDDVWNAIGISAFHSIAAFNNAGVDIFGYSNSYMALKDNVLFNINTMFLIIFGGLGTIVIYDIFTKRRWKKFGVQTKVVLKMTIILLILGTLAIKASEGSNLTILQSAFLSTSSRTAGFITADTQRLRVLTMIIVMLLMFIGAAPMSTGGGVKVSTIYVLFKSIFSFAKGGQTISYKRVIGNETKIKALILCQTAVIIICISTVILVANENASFQIAMFESVSAFSNTGFTIDFTNTLKVTSKLLVATLMFIGRIGPLTVLHLIYSRKASSSNLTYIEEKFIIG